MPRFIVTDPRNPKDEAELPVHFRVLSAGLEPHGHGRDFDPGCGPEIELRFALDAAHVDVLPVMTLAQLKRIEAQIVERLDFHARGGPGRDARACLSAQGRR